MGTRPRVAATSPISNIKRAVSRSLCARACWSWCYKLVCNSMLVLVLAVGRRCLFRTCPGCTQLPTCRPHCVASCIGSADCVPECARWHSDRFELFECKMLTALQDRAVSQRSCRNMTCKHDSLMQLFADAVRHKTSFECGWRQPMYSCLVRGERAKQKGSMT